MYNFLLVINTNFPPVLHRFEIQHLIDPKLLYLAIPLAFNPLMEWFTISPEVIHRYRIYRGFELHFCRRKYIFNRFYAVRRESYQIR